MRHRSHGRNHKRRNHKLTPEISEIDGLPVGVQELDHRVIAVLDTAADGGHVPLHHCHILCHQVLTVTCRTEQRWDSRSEMTPFLGGFHLGMKTSTATNAGTSAHEPRTGSLNQLVEEQWERSSVMEIEEQGLLPHSKNTKNSLPLPTDKSC